MPFVDFSTLQGFPVDKPFERELAVALSPGADPDVSGFTLIISTLAPDGGCTDSHTHGDAGELMVFITGKGKAWLDGKEYELKPGVALYAPPGKTHKTMNTGSESLQIACVFVPAISTEYITRSIEAAKTRKKES